MICSRSHSNTTVAVPELETQFPGPSPRHFRLFFLKRDVQDYPPPLLVLIFTQENGQEKMRSMNSSFPPPENVL